MTPGIPTPPPQPVAPQAPVSNMPQANTPSEGSNKMVIWFVVGLIIVIAAVAGIYFFFSKQQPAAPENTQPVTQAPSPSPSPQANLEGDLNNINVPAEPTTDFAPVDQALQQL